MGRLLAVMGCCLMAGGLGEAAATVHVSPDGADDARGTAADPVRSIGRGLYLADGGETVLVQPGEYPRPRVLSVTSYTDKRRHDPPVTVRGAGPGVEVEGFRVQAASGITFENLHFTGTLDISSVSADIVVEDNEFSGPQENGITLRGGADGVRIANNHFHHIGSAIKAPGYGDLNHPSARVSRDIDIVGNVMEDLRVDGIQFGFWDDVRVEGNLIRRLEHPSGTLHNDGIQLYGRSQRVAIVGNRIFDSGGQGILAGPEQGPIVDLRVEGNVISETAAVPMYLLSVDGLRVIGNTVWKHRTTCSCSGIALRHRDGSSRPMDAIVTGNIATQIAYYMPVTLRADNIVAYKGVRWSGFQAPGVGERELRDPGFVDPSAYDFRLRPDAPALAGVTAPLGALGISG